MTEVTAIEATSRGVTLYVFPWSRVIMQNVRDFFSGHTELSAPEWFTDFVLYFVAR